MALEQIGPVWLNESKKTGKKYLKLTIESTGEKFAAFENTRTPEEFSYNVVGDNGENVGKIFEERTSKGGKTFRNVLITTADGARQKFMMFQNESENPNAPAFHLLRATDDEAPTTAATDTSDLNPGAGAPF